MASDLTVDAASDAANNQRRVLVIDDDHRIHAAIGMILKNARIDHLSAAPEKIEEQLAQYQPTTVLLDLSMPTLDGIAALSLLRTQRYGGRVVVMSGSDRDLIETARRIGQSYGLRMGAGLEKPFRAADLLSAIETEDTIKPSTGTQSDVNRAFALGEICFHYQPKFALTTRELTGFEALVRWQHPSKGLLLPGAFLDQISTAGLKSKLAQAALADAAKRLSEWHARGFSTHISINVAIDEATHPAFVAALTDTVRAMRAPASSLVLELLEASVELDLCAAAATLTQLRLLGIGLSIDDFGTQSSSLARLQHLPANELKIDRSFVMQLSKFRRDQILVRAVIAMAHELGMSSVAEGIEDEATLNLLLDMGCTHGQGFYLAKPLALTDATRVLEESFSPTATQRIA